ncbi:MAG: CCA tRNA nucleotidyltransferase, partial [Mesorhizobium sp.]|nr:CCA tRNA nucleotidyltransferase [Mesorhizobium sp.]
GGYSRLLTFAMKREKPVFPLKGTDLTDIGATPGPKLGAILKNLEKEWTDSGFTLGRDALLKRAAEALET